MQRMSLKTFLLLLLAIMFPLKSEAEEFDSVRVTNIRRAFHNGEHNAFTDMVEFQGRYYLAFRSCPDGHMVHPTSSIIVLASDDGTSWQTVHQFSVKHRDTRDPHFLVFKGRLFLYTGTWYSGAKTLAREDYDLNKHLGYAAWTDDGVGWYSPIMLEGTFGHYIWRATAYGDKAYLCGRRKHEFDPRPRGEGSAVESAMLESRDGLRWTTRALFQERDGDETAFQFEHDGRLLGVARRGSRAAEIVRSSPPFTQWQRTDLDRYIGGPMLVRWGDRWVVGGRRNTSQGPKTSLCWLNGDSLEEFAELPSGGDNSYPGFLTLSDDNAMVSWYSSHEKDSNGKTMTAIYLADLERVAR